MQKVILFGLNEAEADIVRDSGLQCEWAVYDIYQDVIAHYADLTIINPAALDEEGKTALVGFYREIDPIEEKVILVAEDENFSGLSFVETIADLFEYPDSVPLILMKKLKETRRDVDYSRRIMLAIRILRLISLNPGITTRQLTEKVEGISCRSVKRYVRSLQAAGILIDYEDKGWICQMDPRELF